MRKADRFLVALLAGCGIVIAALTWDSSRRNGTVSASPPAEEAVTEEVSNTSGHNGAIGTAHVSSAMLTSLRAAPVRDLSAIRRRLSASAPGTYMPFLLLMNDSALTRWPDRYTNPVKVWIEPRSTVPEWNDGHASMARTAFLAWRSVHLPVRFDFVADSNVAEITVRWREPFVGSQVGATKRYHDQHRWVARAEIELALRAPDGTAIPDAMLRAVAIHEIGHALGLDHSPNRDDIMVPNTGVHMPSADDVATLALLYAVPPGSVKQ